MALPTPWKPENEYDLPPAFIRIDGSRDQCKQIVGDLNSRLDHCEPGEVRKRAYIARYISPADLQTTQIPDVLMLLMRHANIETILNYYVGRNAQKAAEAVWETVADGSDVFGDTAQNEEKPRKAEDNKVIVSKDLKEPPRRVELLTYALRMLNT